jgi:hypothetical protein
MYKKKILQKGIYTMGFVKKNKHNKSDAAPEAQETQSTQEQTKSAPVAKTGKKKKGGMADLFAETVPEQVLSEFSSNKLFVIERNGETQYVGILIKAADMGGLDKKSSSKNADKGQLVQQLNSGAIAAYFTQQLLQDEEIVIIPNATSMANVEEFEMVKDIPWFYVYVNSEGEIEKTDVLTGFDDVSSILKGDYPITDRLEGDNPDTDTSSDSSESSADSEYVDDIMSEEEYEAENPDMSESSDYEEEPDYDDEPYDSDSEDVPIYDDYQPESYDDTYNDDYADENNEYADNYYNEGYEDLPEGEDALPVEDDGVEFTKDQVQEAIIRKFYSDELGLEVSTDPFDSQFVHGNDIARFEENRPEGWLNNYLNEMSRNANVELNRMHVANIYKMKEYYLEAMAKHCEAIQKQLDVQDLSTVYGQQNEMIRKSMLEENRKIEDTVAQRKMEINQEWEAKLNDEAERAAMDARNRYRDRYGKQHDQDLLQIGPMIRTEIETQYQTNLRNMNQQRKSEALKRLDYSINETLAEVSDMYLALLEEEHIRHKELEDEIKEYLDDNRKDDVARAEALAEELRQSQKADAVAAEYTEKFKSLNAEFDAKRVSMQAEIEQIQRENELALQNKEDAWKKKYQESEDIRADQRQEINGLLDKYSSLDAQKAQEYSSRINELKNEKDSWEDKCNHIIATNKHSNIATIFLTIIAVIAALAIGFIAGEFANLKSNQSNTNTAIMQEYQQRLDELEDQNDAFMNQLQGSDLDSNADTVTDSDK